MNLTEFNNLEKEEAASMLKTCCGSTAWVNSMMKNFPFATENDMIASAESSWYAVCNEADWLEAFTHHPKIGDVKSLAEKFASTSHLAGNEQSGVNEATQQVLERLAEGNQLYDQQNGFIFIICATGKPAGEMLRLLEERLQNNREEELQIAMGEQHKITIIRVKKILDTASWQHLKQSQVTTHVLDTTLGKPGKDICIRMKSKLKGQWLTMAQGITNADGRIPDLLPPSRIIPAGNYQMVFDTGKYFNDNQTKGFYPQVCIEFTVTDNSHYHVPLLINPFGYSTYRGS
jgi:5-hydroxyisourate hydrolase / 2-oxo-4-hydroxy-4-carboxy-5-ureidoimidazoline decarboxylase